MKKDIKLKFFNIIDENEISVMNALNDWRQLIEKQKTHIDEWTILPQIPQYKFKNLRIISSPFEEKDDNIELNINLNYDKVELKNN